jgi:hypothetical protein
MPRSQVVSFLQVCKQKCYIHMHMSICVWVYVSMYVYT